MRRGKEQRPEACRQGRDPKASSIIADAPARAFDVPSGRPRPTVAELEARQALSCWVALGFPLLFGLMWMAAL